MVVVSHIFIPIVTIVTPSTNQLSYFEDSAEASQIKFMKALKRSSVELLVLTKFIDYFNPGGIPEKNAAKLKTRKLNVRILRRRQKREKSSFRPVLVALELIRAKGWARGPGLFVRVVVTMALACLASFFRADNVFY